MKSFFISVVVCAVMVGCATTTKSGTGGYGSSASKTETAEIASGPAMSHYLTSVIHMNTGNYEGAIKELRKAADLTPGDETLQVRLLAMYYRDQDYENAAIMAERALAGNPENVMLNIWLGRIYYQLDRIDDAIDTFQVAIGLDPTNTLGYEALAEVEEQSNDLVGAVEVYEELIQLNPDSPFLHYRLGINLLEMGDGENARTILEKALSLNPSLTPAMYMLGIVYLEQNEFDKAIEQFRNFLNENNEHAASWENLAGAYAQKGDLRAALGVMKLIIESDQVNTRHHLYNAYLLLRQGEIQDSSVVVAPNGSPILGTLLQALVRRQAGEPYQKSIESLDSIDGDLDAECTIYLNDIISKFGMDETAAFLEQELRRLMEDGIQSRTVGIVLGRVLLASQENAKAQVVLEQVLRDYGSEKWLHYYLATANEGLDNDLETEKQLRLCLELDPNDPDVLNFLGYHLAEVDQDLSEAKKLLDRALLMEPENGYYMDSLGWIYYRMGEGEKAVDLIRRAIRAMPSDDGILRGHLGDAYWMIGEKTKAIAEWERAVRLDPSLEDIQEKLKKHGSRNRS